MWSIGPVLLLYPQQWYILLLNCLPAFLRKANVCLQNVMNYRNLKKSSYTQNSTTQQDRTPNTMLCRAHFTLANALLLSLETYGSIFHRICHPHYWATSVVMPIIPCLRTELRTLTIERENDANYKHKKSSNSFASRFVLEIY
jgi:hypothetical protein